MHSWILLRQHRRDAALPMIEQGLGLARRVGEPRLIGRLLSVRSYAGYVQGDPGSAVRDAAEALRLFRQTTDRLQVGSMLGNLGNYELAAGDLEGACRHLAESLEIARATNSRDDIVHETFNSGLAEYLAGSPDTAGPLFAESFDLARRMGMKVNMAYALLGLALAGPGQADPRWSARMHGAAQRALSDLGQALEPVEGQLADADCQRLRAAMGDGSFDAEYSAGQSLDLAQVLEALSSTGPAERASAVLTRREVDVLTLVAQGLSNADIAERLVLSEHTVHRHVANILRKLSLSSRAAAAAWGVRAGLL
jgi:DNA-binding CsgD family transcriptional regulator